MRIRVTKKNLTIYRPGPTRDGRTVEVRVTSMPLDTSVESIPPNVVDELSPKDLRAVKTELGRIMRDRAAAKAKVACDVIAEISQLVRGGYLSEADVNKVFENAKGLIGDLKKLMRRNVGGPNVAVDTNGNGMPEAASISQTGSSA